MLCFLALIGVSGCRSPYFADRGAGLGALAGAGAGAIIGDATGGDAGAGAVIGAGLGALTGAVAGSAMDEMQAQNRAEIAAQLGRQVQAGAATKAEVISMSQSGVDPRLIQNYIRSSGMAAPLSATDVIQLHQQGVATEVIEAMQQQSQAGPPAAVIQQGRPVVAGPPVIVEEHVYGPPWYGPPWHGPRRYYHRPGPRVHWGISFSK